MANETYLESWKTYQAAWSNISDDERRKKLSDSVSDDVTYSDPNGACKGVEALIEKIVSSQQKAPGASFRNDKFLDHHDQGLSAWTMFDKDMKVVTTGTSYARFGADGKIVQATGFFETKPS